MPKKSEPTLHPLLSALHDIRGTGDFCAKGSFPFVFPGIRLPNGEELSLPLSGSQAREIASFAEAAPFGKGEETVYDEKVRKCWQIDAGELEWESTDWKLAVELVVREIADRLGVAGKVAAEPYKLLLYGEGGFFRPHRDTEKLDAMFGSLIVALPSGHTGGKLRVRHDGRETVVDFSKKKWLRKLRYAAFFADCEHEVEPVGSGYRLCLAYNLILKKGDPGELNPSLSSQAASLIPHLENLRKDRGAALSAIVLDHRYTEANLSFAGLKNDDRARAKALVSAAEETGFTAHLALMTLHQSGELEGGDYGYSRRRRWYDDDEDEEPVEGTMGEIYEESLYLDCWRDTDDRPASVGSYGIDEERVIALGEIGTGEPDEKEGEGFTGNAGCTMDYWYRRAAIVLWPREADETIRVEYDFGGACAHLLGLAERGGGGKSGEFARLARAATAKARTRLAVATEYTRADSCKKAVPILEAIAGSGNGDLYAECHADGLADDLLEHSASAVWKKVVGAFGGVAVLPVLDRFSEGDSSRFWHPLFSALSALLSSKKRGKPEEDALATAVKALPDMLHAAERADARFQDRYRWSDPGKLARKECCHIAIAASGRIEDPETRGEVFRALAGEGLGHVRDVLAPALLAKQHRRYFSEEGSLFRDLLADATRRLGEEVGSPLGPYTDWSRPFPEAEKRAPNKLIRELAEFVESPEEETHRFAQNEQYRRQLKEFIRRHSLDLDTTTEKTGRPYTLVCRKNDKSYHRAVKRRADDGKLLGQLEGLGG